jgi:hypothetical protein
MLAVVEISRRKKERVKHIKPTIVTKICIRLKLDYKDSLISFLSKRIVKSSLKYALIPLVITPLSSSDND